MTSIPGETETRARNCPVCGSDKEGAVVVERNVDAGRLDEFAFASRKRPEFMHHRLVLCTQCDLLFANPAPTPGSLELAYRAASYDSAEESKYASLTYASHLDHLMPTLPAGGGALDIGTGDGAFLERLLERNFDDVVGIEPSEAPVQHATAQIRPHIRLGAFNPNDLGRDRFRLVTCFQTLEHLDDPVAVCRGAYEMLRPGGALLVVCHNRRAPLNRVLGRKSPIYDIEHLQLFSPPALRVLFKRSGFRAVRQWPIRNRYPLRYWTNLSPLPMEMRRRMAAALDRVGLGRAPVSLPVGNVAVVGYKPSS